MVVLDSDLLVGLARENRDAIEFLEKSGLQEGFNITSVTEFQIYEGAMMTSNQEKIAKAKTLVDSFNSYGFDSKAARKAAEIFSELKRSGTPLDFEDVIIASIAITHDEKLVTRNVKHFSRIKGLKIEKW